MIFMLKLFLLIQHQFQNLMKEIANGTVQIA